MVKTSTVEDDQVAHNKKETNYPQNNNEEKLIKVQYINHGEEDQMEIQGFVESKMKTNIIWLLYLLTAGVLRLFFHWYPHLHLKATHTRTNLKKAEKILIIDSYRKYKSYFVKHIKILEVKRNGNSDNKQPRQLKQEHILEFNLCDGRQKQLCQARIIRCKKLLYIWDDEKETFFKLAGFDKGLQRTELFSLKGQSKEKQDIKRIIYGENEISVPVQTITKLILLEALTPFYIFQLFSLTVWMVELYFHYTVAIIIMSVVGISTSVLQTRKNQKNLKGTVNFVDTATVCRGDNLYETIPTTELVPGDLIAIPYTGCDMHCDAVLLSGACVVNESMLTGESVPITKTPLPNNFIPYNLKEDVNHTLFSGTKVIQTRSKDDEKVLAVVIRTGYLTAKGELVRSILYPPPADFKFESDSYKFIGILAIIALVSVIYTIVSKLKRNILAVDILIKSLDVITIAVPPALPAAMTVGKLYALNRLKNQKIFCINSRVINVSGSIDCICFDKTGTLTEDELDMWGIVPVNNEIEDVLKDTKKLPLTSPLLRGMATCHSLTTINGELGGDPLDLKMFESTGWDLIDSVGSSKEHIIVKPKESQESLEIGIVKQFQFSSNLQRMSVISHSSDSNAFTAFCKGAPETIMTFSRQTSVPRKLLDRLKDYTQQGYRVIGLAKKDLQCLSTEEAKNLHREEVECDLDFVGLIILENKLKPESTEIIRTLKSANLKVVMITGDNIQTGVHIAKECGIVEPNEEIIEIVAEEISYSGKASIKYNVTNPATIQENCNANSLDIEKTGQRHYCFTVSGKSWANVMKYHPELVPKFVAKGLVFARMSGSQKQQLVEEFKNLGYYVAMCGDGANDCGALKAAHVGISLSEAESSVASPFTSKEQNISCVPKVIKEGRAALETSFGVFKVMLCSSLTELTSVLILYNIDANLGSLQFLFIDICLILNFASVFGNAKANETLHKSPPKTSLMGFIPISSMVCFMVLAIMFQLVGYYWIQTFDWFVPFKYNQSDDMNFLCYENYAVYATSIFQYIIMCVVFSKGKPYRKPLYTNIYFTLSLIIMTAISAYMVVIPMEWLRVLIELKLPPLEGRYTMIFIAFVNFVVCIIIEDLVVELFLGKMISPKFRNIQKIEQKFLSVLKDLNEEDRNWTMIEDVILNSHFENENKGVINNGFVGSQNNIVSKC
ncbi:unnamed protein product [Phaedon cochleariae]|uniref:Cation-transporting ATPase n=1 Tax=Phaedon cochleariae TaxID=80249 RepID=A0A9P0GQ88_PHACE|nr:unnamed protein product [Phaedon cochleariae]